MAENATRTLVPATSPAPSAAPARPTRAAKPVAGTIGDLPVTAEPYHGPLAGPVNGETNLMAYPFFSLDKRPRAGAKPKIFDDGKVRIEVRGAGELGIATIWDADFLWYIASLMLERIARGETPPKRWIIRIANFMSTTGRDSSGRSHARIEGMIARLQGTQNRTTIKAGGEAYTGYFSWFPQADIDWKTNSSGKRVMRAIRVEICDWLYNSIMKDRHLLAIHLPEKYFRLSPVQRRLYEIARSQCTAESSYRIRLEDLRARVGAEMKLDKFHHMLKTIASSDSEKDRLHAYDLALTYDQAAAEADNGRRDSLKHIVVIFTARASLTALPARPAPMIEDEIVEGVAVG